MLTLIQNIGKSIRKNYKKLQGCRLVPEGHLMIIEQDGQIVRLAEPGYAQAELYQDYGPLIPFGPQVPVELSLEGVRLLTVKNLGLGSEFGTGLILDGVI